mgnify:CR=1 FL=1
MCFVCEQVKQLKAKGVNPLVLFSGDACEHRRSEGLWGSANRLCSQGMCLRAESLLTVAAV